MPTVSTSVVSTTHGGYFGALTLGIFVVDYVRRA